MESFEVEVEEEEMADEAVLRPAAPVDVDPWLFCGLLRAQSRNDLPSGEDQNSEDRELVKAVGPDIQGWGRLSGPPLYSGLWEII